MGTCMKDFTAANFLFIACSFSATFPPKYHDNYASYTHLQRYYTVRARELHSSHGIRVQCVQMFQYFLFWCLICILP